MTHWLRSPECRAWTWRRKQRWGTSLPCRSAPTPSQPAQAPDTPHMRLLRGGGLEILLWVGNTGRPPRATCCVVDILHLLNKHFASGDQRSLAAQPLPDQEEQGRAQAGHRSRPEGAAYSPHCVSVGALGPHPSSSAN